MVESIDLLGKDDCVSGDHGSKDTGKERASRWNADKEIRTLLAEIHADDGALAPSFEEYAAEKAPRLKAQPSDRLSIAQCGLKYEWLDQLNIALLAGVRECAAPTHVNQVASKRQVRMALPRTRRPNHGFRRHPAQPTYPR